MKWTSEHTQYLNEVVADFFTPLSLSQFSLFSSYFKNPKYHQHKVTNTKLPEPNH